MSQTVQEDDYDELVYTSNIPYSKRKCIVWQDRTANSRPHYYQMLNENVVDIMVYVKDKKDARIPKIDKVWYFGNITRKINSRSKIIQNLFHTEMDLFNLASTVQSATQGQRHSWAASLKGSATQGQRHL